MIGKRGKILILLYMAGLFILFLMCFTDLIIREPEKEVYEVAVIIEDTRDDNYSNFRKGMDQAAVEFNADVHFITLYEKLDAQQQMELIEREEKDGADALIVAPVDERQFGKALSEKQTDIPAVLLGTGVTEAKTAGKVIVDYKKMGELLADKMTERVPESCSVLLLAEFYDKDILSSDFLEGAKDVLEKGGYSVQMAELEEADGYGKVYEMLAEERMAILAGSPEILAEIAGARGENPDFAVRIEGLYGRGNTLEILNDLDRELIEGICVTDEFSRGYYSVLMAVQALDGKNVREPFVIKPFYVEKKDLRKPEYEKILFPME